MSPCPFNNPDIEGRLNPDIAGSVLWAITQREFAVTR